MRDDAAHYHRRRLHHDVAPLPQGVHGVLLPEIGDDEVLQEGVNGREGWRMPVEKTVPIYAGAAIFAACQNRMNPSSRV